MAVPVHGSSVAVAVLAGSGSSGSGSRRFMDCSGSRTVPVHAVPVRTVRLWHPVRAVRFSIGSGLPVPVPFTSFM